MSARALCARREGPVLTLTLDTPGASVNVFGPAAAAELDAALAALPAGVELLVLASAKPGSFVNGAGLLYAQAMESAARARALSAPVRGVYERLARARPLTVAVVEGNCFGCGLELALCCDVLLARDAEEVRFRMTELTDYRFVPLFGGTWRLPRRVGPAAAARLLLDGEAWDARAARRAGLVDAVLPSQGFAPALEAALARLRTEGAPRRRPPPEGRARYAPVPPVRAGLWARTAALLDAAPGLPPGRARARELAAFADTVTTREAKRAMSYFYVRHAARAAALGDAQRRPPAVRLAGGGLPGMDGAPSALEGRRTLRLVRAGPGLLRGPGFRVLLPWGPAHPACEVALDAPGARADACEAVRALEWAGRDAVLTTPGPGRSVSARLLAATRAELARLHAAGVGPARVARALWDAGFAHPFPAPGWPRRPGPRGAPGVRERLAAVWTAVLVDALGRGQLRHAAQGDALVHALFDFPLEDGSLLRWVDALGLAALEAAARAAGGRPRLPRGPRRFHG